MNLCLFFEGTGQGVSGNFTNVTRLHDACASSAAQRLHLESGPGTHFGSYVRGLVHGHDWWIVFRCARRWFEANCRSREPSAESERVFLFGFSRGALIARRFAEWLNKLGVEVAYLGLWDTVDATLGLDVDETAPPNVLSARHAVARDETRRLFEYVPLRGREPSARRPNPVEELVFPGSHSDVGGLFEDNHAVADVTLAWIAEGAWKRGLLLKDKSVLSPSGSAEIVLHDQHGEATNLWGLLGRVGRKLDGLRKHRLCSRGQNAYTSPAEADDAAGSSGKCSR